MPQLPDYPDWTPAPAQPFALVQAGSIIFGEAATAGSIFTNTTGRSLVVTSFEINAVPVPSYLLRGLAYIQWGYAPVLGFVTVASSTISPASPMATAAIPPGSFIIPAGKDPQYLAYTQAGCGKTICDVLITYYLGA